MKTLVRIVVAVGVASALVLSASAADGAKTPKGKGPVVAVGERGHDLPKVQE